MDDLLVFLGVLVMIAQQAVIWLCAIYQPPTLAILYAVILMGPSMVWYVHTPCSIVIYIFIIFFRLARGSILASVIRIMPSGPLKVVAFYVSGLFLAFYIVAVAQFVWVCETKMLPTPTGYVYIFGFHIDLLTLL
jgi:hypothetical protein